jgi:hypothetical protein
MSIKFISKIDKSSLISLYPKSKTRVHDPGRMKHDIFFMKMRI